MKQAPDDALSPLGITQGYRNTSTLPTLLCIVPIVPFFEPEELRDNRYVSIITRTWGLHCDQLVFVGPQALPEFEGFQFVQVSFSNDDDDDEEEEGDKTFHAKVWVKIFELYSSKADWFIKVERDTFVIVRNFKKYVSADHGGGSEPRYVGRRIKGEADGEDINWHAAGYALNQAALNMFGKALRDEQPPNCKMVLGSDESADVAQCLKQIGISPEDTRDSLGRERFMPYGLMTFYDSSWLGTKTFFQDRSYSTEGSEGCCSTQAITFSSLSEVDLLEYYFIFYASE